MMTATAQSKIINRKTTTNIVWAVNMLNNILEPFHALYHSLTHLNPKSTLIVRLYSSQAYRHPSPYNISTLTCNKLIFDNPPYTKFVCVEYKMEQIWAIDT